MKYKLVDFIPGEPIEVQTGTCELCFGTTTECDDTFILEDENGKQYEVDSKYWSWGDMFEIVVDNVIDFAAWLEKQDVPEEDDMNWGTLERLVDEYYDEKDKVSY